MNEEQKIALVQGTTTNGMATLPPAGKGSHIYFIGIGGIGMSAIARYFHTQGYAVSGYDRTPTPLTNTLAESGININYNDEVDLLPKDAILVVYTPAVPATHKQLAYYRQHNYTVVKRSDVLKLITAQAFNICVGGTHGKTTVSTMIAHLLRDSGYGCNAFLGGIAANYNTNFWSNERNVCVVEADEYDRSFLKLFPDVAVITAMDPDHLDIYGTPEEVENAFIAFTQKLKPGGLLVAKLGLKRSNEFVADSQLTYSLNNSNAKVYATDISMHQGSYRFDVNGPNWKLTNVALHMGGLHNIENMIAAIAVAKTLEIEDERIIEAVGNFKGVRRRFEYVIKSDEQVLIDDYAHHPEELRALITGVRSVFSERLVIVFQPHLFSRTNDLATDFASVLDTADEVILLPIYPARELPMEGVTSEIVYTKMQLQHKHIMTKDEILDWVAKEQPRLLVMAGAGDIDALVNPVKLLLENETR